MRLELDERLCREFPLLYADRHEAPTATCMCWGFNVGDGWFPLLYELSAQLEPLIAAQPEPRARAAQVKEKFGGLRFYLDNATDAMAALIAAAEARAWVTCEECGQPGTARRDGWIKVRCDACHAAHVARP